jgi:hypothetical protein
MTIAPNHAVESMRSYLTKNASNWDLRHNWVEVGATLKKMALDAGVSPEKVPDAIAFALAGIERTTLRLWVDAVATALGSTTQDLKARMSKSLEGSEDIDRELLISQIAFSDGLVYRMGLGKKNARAAKMPLPEKGPAVERLSFFAFYLRNLNDKHFKQDGKVWVGADPGADVSGGHYFENQKNYGSNLEVHTALCFADGLDLVAREGGTGDALRLRYTDPESGEKKYDSEAAAAFFRIPLGVAKRFYERLWSCGGNRHEWVNAPQFGPIQIADWIDEFLA